MKIDAATQRQLVGAIDLIRSFIENIEPQKGCISCFNWSNGCGLADKAIPPQDTINNGCPKWELFDEIPY